MRVVEDPVLRMTKKSILLCPLLEHRLGSIKPDIALNLSIANVLITFIALPLIFF